MPLPAPTHRRPLRASVCFRSQIFAALLTPGLAITLVYGRMIVAGSAPATRWQNAGFW